MFDYITTIPALNTARHKLDAALIASLNDGTITDAEDAAQADAIADAYETAIHKIWAVQQSKRDRQAIGEAHRLGFTDSQFSTPAAVQKTVQAYGAKTMAGFPVKETPEGDAALARVNRVSVLLTDASAAYERIHKADGS